MTTGAMKTFRQEASKFLLKDTVRTKGTVVYLRRYWDLSRAVFVSIRVWSIT